MRRPRRCASPTAYPLRPIDRFRTFQIAGGIFLAAYLLGHMNSAFVFARLDLDIDSDWALATAASGKDAWDTRLMIFVLSHLAAGARALMLSRGVARLYPGIIATGDVRRGRDTKLVVPRNRWFESISLQGESANHRFRSRQGWRRRNGRAWYARFYPSSGLGPASLLASASARRPFSSASAIVDLCSPVVVLVSLQVGRARSVGSARNVPPLMLASLVLRELPIRNAMVGVAVLD